MEEFSVTINQFDGPLDLMLHLIHEKELDLMNLDVNELASQYIAYIHSMQRLHLEIAGEYLAQLASLIEYKSRQLLPNSKEELEDHYEQDTREALVRRLLEYQQFKEIREELEVYYEQRQLKYTRPMIEYQPSDIETMEGFQGNPYDLLKAMARLWRRKQLEKPIPVRYTVKEISMEDRVLELKIRFHELPDCFKFENLIEDCETKQELIVTFLAILDLARKQKCFIQLDEKDFIWIQKGNN